MATPRNAALGGDPLRLPMELRALHRAGRPASDLEVTFADPLPTQLAQDLLDGAGFEVIDPQAAGATAWRSVRLRRLRTLSDTVGPDMDLLLVGLNPSLHAADSGVGFSGPSNRGWPALAAAGIATVDRDPEALLERGVGMTDLVKRATPRASELAAREYRDGLGRLERLCALMLPGAVCIVGLAGWRAAVDRHATAGRQDRDLGGRPVWLMPNPSGLNAHSSLEDLAGHLRSALALAEEARST